MPPPPPADTAAESRAVLAAAWAALPPALRSPTQFIGRKTAGCGAVIGAMPRCDFACRGCYLGTDANRARPRPVAEISGQLLQLRQWLGPGGSVQLTDGELTLRPEPELVEIIAVARRLGLVPMLMTHGETFRRRPGLLERLMTEGGLTEVAIHVDTTQRGRRDAYAGALHEAELDGLRTEFAGMIREARRRTGRRLEAASTVTVTRGNLADVPGVVRWFLGRADAFKMVSFQPLAAVGRTDRALGGVTVQELWARIAEGGADPELARGEGWFGHPACSRFVQGFAVHGRGGPRLVPMYHGDDPREAAALAGLLERLGAATVRSETRPGNLRALATFCAWHPAFTLRRLLPQALRVLRRAGTVRGRYFCVVSHHFMSAAEAATPPGRERLAACSFRVPVDGVLQPMCAVNALGLREAYYRAGPAGKPDA
ncbi:MAG: radical SAM protein [Limisphaerales bacterium]